MENPLHTPADLVIQPRNVMFARDRVKQRWWHGGNPFATAFYNSLSLTFPKGEAFFIESVRHFRDRVPNEFQPQIDAFIKQEAAHSREHAHLNDQVEQAGYDTRQMHAYLDGRIADMKARPPIAALFATAALEHFTAIIAHAILKNESHMRGATKEAADLWKWHAIEEIEHKGVAYDTLLAATSKLSAFRRWQIRSLVMLSVSSGFVRGRVRAMRLFLKQDGITGLRAWLGVAKYLLVYPGILRQVFPAWLSFFRPGFHPWQHDDRDLVSTHETLLGLPVSKKDALIRLT